MPQYTEVDLGAPSGIVISAEGREKSGKTWSVLATAPEPLVYINCDRDNRRTVKLLRAQGRKILTSGQYLYVPKMDLLHKPGQQGDDPVLVENARQAGELWKPILRDFKDGLADPKVKTVVLDSGSAAYALLRTKTFGKLTGVKDLLYAKTNYQWREMLMSADVSGKVVIFIHRLKPEYTDKVDSAGNVSAFKTGKWVMDGYNQTNYEVGAIVRHTATATGFRCQVMAEGVGRGDIKGIQLEGEELDYTAIVAKLTRTKREKWL